MFELLEKTLVLAGQCNNKIISKNRGDEFLAVTGPSSAHDARMFKECLSFLLRHEKSLIEK